jgi:hypothetical protein
MFPYHSAGSGECVRPIIKWWDTSPLGIVAWANLTPPEHILDLLAGSRLRGQSKSATSALRSTGARRGALDDAPGGDLSYGPIRRRDCLLPYERMDKRKVVGRKTAEILDSAIPSLFCCVDTARASHL